LTPCQGLEAGRLDPSPIRLFEIPSAYPLSTHSAVGQPQTVGSGSSTCHEAASIRSISSIAASHPIASSTAGAAITTAAIPFVFIMGPRHQIGCTAHWHDIS
jgi:hypothetical protein